MAQSYTKISRILLERKRFHCVLVTGQRNMQDKYRFNRLNIFTKYWCDLCDFSHLMIMFIGRTYVEAEIPILWPPDAKSRLIWTDPDAGKDWGQEEKGMTEDEMVGWHHWLDGHEFEWTPGVGDGQGGLACCSSWCCKVLDRTEWLNWTELNWMLMFNCRSFYIQWENRNIQHFTHLTELTINRTHQSIF